MKPLRLPGLQLQFAENAESIQLFRIGTFYHPSYGKFEITREMLSELKTNFDKRVRGIDIAIDYKHDSENIAAGWIKELHLSDDGDALFATVDWTPKGSQVINDKEFRYISPEFTTEYTDNETLTKHGPTLLGAGLTNRPVIKKMEPVVELSEDEMSEIKKEESMKAGASAPNNKIQLPKGGNKMQELEKMSPEELIAMIKDLQAQMGKMKGEHEAMMADNKKMCAEIAEGKKKAEFTKLLSEGKVCPAQEEAFLKGDMAKFVELAQPLKLSETGSNKKEQDATHELPAPKTDDDIIKASEQLVADKKFDTMAAAMRHVMISNPEIKKTKYSYRN